MHKEHKKLKLRVTIVDVLKTNYELSILKKVGMVPRYSSYIFVKQFQC